MRSSSLTFRGRLALLRAPAINASSVSKIAGRARHCAARTIVQCAYAHVCMNAYLRWPLRMYAEATRPSFRHSNKLQESAASFNIAEHTQHGTTWTHPLLFRHSEEEVMLILRCTAELCGRASPSYRYPTPLGNGQAGDPKRRGSAAQPQPQSTACTERTARTAVKDRTRVRVT